MAKSISHTGVNLIMKYTECHLTPWKYDVDRKLIFVGYCSLDIDHTVDKTVGIVHEEAEERLLKDCQRVIEMVSDKSVVSFTEELNQNQFDALVSFAYENNRSGLHHLCKNRDLHEVSAALLKYTTDSVTFEVDQHRAMRRAEECALFCMDIDSSTKTDFNTTPTAIVSSNGLALQRAINLDGVDSITEDGRVAYRTKLAIRKISLSAKRDVVRGIWTVGSTGECVRFVQMRLGIAEDGCYGAGTRAAVIVWQTIHKLTPDGICGPVTLMTMI